LASASVKSIVPAEARENSSLEKHQSLAVSSPQYRTEPRLRKIAVELPSSPYSQD
jgi:hypothetical protein